jgi:hypothetical protein
MNMIFPDITPNMFHIDLTSHSNLSIKGEGPKLKKSGVDALPTYKEWWPGFWTLWRIRGSIFSDFIG